MTQPEWQCSSADNGSRYPVDFSYIEQLQSLRNAVSLESGSLKKEHQMTVKALKGKVLVTDLERGSRIVKGIIIPDDNGKSEGIRPRWGRVYSVGEGVTEVAPGQWILIENGRWTRMLKVKDETGTEIQLWGVEWPKSAMLVSDTDPETEIFSEFTTTHAF